MKEYAEIISMCLLHVIENGELGLKTILNCKVPSDVMLSEYRRLAFRIEDVSEDEKKELWEYANSNFPDRTKEEKINICKIVKTIGNLV